MSADGAAAVMAKMSTPAVMDGLMDARARASEAMDGLLDHTAFVRNTGAFSTSNVLGGLVVFLTLWHALLPSLDEAFALIPHHTVFSPVAFIPLPFIWNLATSHFFEASLVKLVMTAPWLVALTRMLERLWTARAVAIHLIFTAAGSGFGFFVIQVMHVYRTHREREFFAPFRGCIGLVVALAVGLRHAYPFEALPLLPRHWGLQCQHLPFGLTVTISLVGWLMPWLFPEWPFAPFGLFFAWLHLRYLMWFPYAQAHGDHSPEFSFAALFPKQLRGLVGCVGMIVHGISATVAPGFVRLREDADGALGHVIMYDPTKSAEADGATHAGANVAASMGSGSNRAAELQLGSLGGLASAANTAEFNARRAKALALLDENISSLLGGGRAALGGSRKEDRSRQQHAPDFEADGEVDLDNDKNI